MLVLQVVCPPWLSLPLAFFAVVSPAHRRRRVTLYGACYTFGHSALLMPAARRQSVAPMAVNRAVVLFFTGVVVVLAANPRGKNKEAKNWPFQIFWVCGVYALFVRF